MEDFRDGRRTLPHPGRRPAYDIIVDRVDPAPMMTEKSMIRKRMKERRFMVDRQEPGDLSIIK